jgi:hypothetical protein
MKQQFWMTALAVSLTVLGLWANPTQAQAACPDGKLVTVDTAGQCCWPGQAWSKTKSKCIGSPDCPSGFSAEGESCVKKGGGALQVADKSFVRNIRPDAFRTTIEGLGWKVVGEETRINNESITLPIVKQFDGGAASLNVFDVKAASDVFEETMTQNADAVVVRDGNRFITVVMPGKRQIAEQLMKQLLSSKASASATTNNNTNNNTAKGQQVGLNNPKVARITPAQLEARAKAMGWKIISEPTRVNPKSITLSVVKGTVGGAFSLNEFDVPLATDTFVKTMAGNEGAQMERSGNKVLTVILPTNPQLSRKVLTEILSK